MKLLQATLDEEKATDLKLTQFAERAGNQKASQESGGEVDATQKSASKSKSAQANAG